MFAIIITGTTILIWSILTLGGLGVGSALAGVIIVRRRNLEDAGAAPRTSIGGVAALLGIAIGVWVFTRTRKL